MRTAIACWRGRIAPLFDTAGSVELLDEARDPGDPPVGFELEGRGSDRVMKLVEIGAGRLVCGAISSFLLDLLTAAGIEVVPFISGGVTEIEASLRAGRDLRREHPMPGCGRGCRLMGGFGRGTGGGAEGGPAGGSQAGRQRGSGGGAGAGGVCRCPACGLEQPHQRGVPCGSVACPGCGARMVRA